MQNLSSQQSIVRTDFTLKYYALDEKLASDPLLKVHGPDAGLFIRSWLEYAGAGGNCIIHWAEGDFAALLSSINDRFQSNVDSTDGLLELLAEQGAQRKVIFVVDAQQVPSTQFSLLFQTLRNSDSQNKTDNATRYPAKLVLYFKAEEIASYQKVLSAFSQSLQIGAAAGQGVAAGKKYFATGMLGALLLAFIIGGVSYWQVLKNSDSEFSLWIANISGWQPDPGTAKLSSAGAARDDNFTSADAAPKAKNTNLLASGDSAATISKTQSIAATKNVEPAVAAVIEDNNVTVKNVTEKNAAIAKPADKSAEVTDNQSGLLLQDSNASSSIAGASGAITLIDDQVTQTSKDDPEAVAELIATTDTQIPPQQAELATTEADANTEEQVLTVGKKADTGQQSIASAESIESPTVIIDPVVTEKDQQLVVQQHLELLIDDWIAAWQQQDFKKYSAFYGPKFTVGKKLSHRGWLKWRKQRIEKPKWIKLSRSAISFITPDGDEQVSMTFTLNYESPNYQDETLKKLTLKSSAQSYQIILEENVQVTRIR